MSLLIATLALGLVFAILALGVFVAFRIYRTPDITADGSFALGAAVSARLIVDGCDPVTATLAAFVAGAVAGMTTGIIHVHFKVHALLAGVLVMTALYSINLRVMGRSNLPISSHTIFTPFESAARWVWGNEAVILGREVPSGDLGLLFASALFVLLAAFALVLLLKTELGAAMRATGDNPRMLRALGTSTDRMMILGLGVSNALVALSGSLVAQMQTFADAQMGIGVIVLGLASVIIGQTLIGTTRSISLAVAGALVGALLFRLLVAIAIRVGLNPNDLKLVTAVVVLVAIIAPGWLQRFNQARAMSDAPRTNGGARA